MQQVLQLLSDAPTPGQQRAARARGGTGGWISAAGWPGAAGPTGASSRGVSTLEGPGVVTTASQLSLRQSHRVHCSAERDNAYTMETHRDQQWTTRMDDTLYCRGPV